MNQNHQEDVYYGFLDSKTKAIVSQRTLEIKNLMRLTTDNIITIGQKLIEVKQQLKHGTFQDWLKTEFEWSEQTARQFMQVYRWSETIKNKDFVFSQLATSALYLLAAPSTSSQAREKIIGMVNQGEKITYTRAKAVVESYKKLPTTKAKTIDIKADIEPCKEIPQIKPEKTISKLFRLEASDLGCIVRLYKNDEIASNTELILGTTVTIQVGSLKGHTAKIAEVLTDSQPSPPNTLDSLAKLEQQEIVVRAMKQIDSTEKEALRRSNRHLIVSLGNSGLTIEGNADTLIAFVKQIQTNSTVVEKIFKQIKEQNTNSK